MSWLYLLGLLGGGLGLLVVVLLAFLYARYLRFLKQYPTAPSNFLMGSLGGFTAAAKESRYTEYHVSLRERLGDTYQMILPLALGRIIISSDVAVGEYVFIQKNMPKSPKVHRILFLAYYSSTSVFIP